MAGSEGEQIIDQGGQRRLARLPQSAEDPAAERASAHAGQIERLGRGVQQPCSERSKPASA